MNPYSPLRNKRQSHRLRNHDYRQPGAYFVTICTFNRECSFGDVVDGRMQYTYIGQIALAHWKTLPQHLSDLEMDVWQVMPNHLHGILILKNEGGTAIKRSSEPVVLLDKPRPQKGTMAGSIGAIIQNYKKVTTRKARQITGDNELQLWQRDYYDHVIRSESDLNRIREYIIQNPSMWHKDSENGQQE